MDMKKGTKLLVMSEIDPPMESEEEFFPAAEAAAPLALVDCNQPNLGIMSKSLRILLSHNIYQFYFGAYLCKGCL